MKRKISAIALALLMTSMVMTGCTSDSTASVTEASSAEETTVSEAPLFEMTPMRDISSMELIGGMKIGWNLGNTLDSQRSSYTGEETAEEWETAWGQPVTTKRMIDSVAAQGFNVIRIPVTWEGKFGSAPDYKIREDWLARVKEIVDYAYANDMYVILNTHHEEWYFPTKEHEEEDGAVIKALWTQIAEYFKDYNEKLIFEGLNEPRLRGTASEWTGGTAEAREVIAHWEQIFVDAVRSTGGNNTLRHLMITPYAASSSKQVLDSFELPDDDKVIVSVHAYLPYSFALADEGTMEWSGDNDSDITDIANLIDLLKTKYIDNGQAVIIGEFGARNRINTDARAEWAKYYVETASAAGIPCVWWDNNSFVQGEAFGLLDRRTYEWRYPKIMSALMEACEKSGEE